MPVHSIGATQGSKQSTPCLHCFRVSKTRKGVPSPADSLAWERGHVGHVSQPSDRPGRRPRSSFPFLFYKKILDFSRNKTRRPSLSLSEIFKKPPQILPKPTRSPPPPGQQYFPKDPCVFLKSTRHPFSLSGTIIERPSNFT